MTANINIKKNIKLAPHTTFRIGGLAKFFVAVKNSDEMVDAVLWAKKEKVKYFILGGGSNILFSDEGYDGLVIKIANKKIELTKSNLSCFSSNPPTPLVRGASADPPLIRGARGVNGRAKSTSLTKYNLSPEKQNLIIASAGANLNQLVKFSIENNLSGLEWASGIYGTVGGAVFGNAGANGGCMSDVVEEVEIFDGKKIKVLKHKDLKFKYRSSAIKKGEIIISVKLKLKKGNKFESEKLVKKYLKKRSDRQPKGFCAGSVFRNPKNTSAGLLIEKCGLKGLKIGDAQISEKHGNFIINLGNAKAKDVLKLIQKVKSEVKKKFKLELEEELTIM